MHDGNVYENTFYTDEVAARKMVLKPIAAIFSGVSYLWNLIMMIPYYFLFFHFYKADRANTYLVGE